MSSVIDLSSRRRAPRWHRIPGLTAMAALAGLFGAFALLDGPEAARAPVEPSAARYALCMNGSGPNCVVDGDTLRHGGTRIRIADIDAPEVFSPACPAERELGEAAARRLVELVNAGPFEMRRDDHRDEDVYGRKLRVLVRDGTSLGQVLVAEGLARPWDGARRDWC